MTTPILDEIQVEALRLVQTAQTQGVILRLLGGLAVRIHSPSASHRALARVYPDLDFATPTRRASEVEKFIASQGYTPNKNFNLLNGDRRLLFYDEAHARQIDIFVAHFEMCHRLPISERMHLESLTLPLAELLLTKLQIVQLNEKDIRDLCALLYDHPLGDADAETINLPRITQLCAEDWGLWKTVRVSLEKVQAFCEAHVLEPEFKATIAQRVDNLRMALDEAPKSLRWKLRARVGEKLPWYELPEEVRRG